MVLPTSGSGPVGSFMLVPARQDTSNIPSYGITELACSMCECEAGMGGHVNPQFVHAEVLDETGSPVPDGQFGQLVAIRCA